MKKIYILLSFIIISCSDNKTEFEKYNELTQKAMLAFKDQDFDQALSNFQKAIALKPKEGVSVYFFATASALHLGKTEKAKELLIASIHNTNASKDYFLKFDEFDKFRTMKLFADIENDYDKHIATFYHQLEHPEIYKAVDSLIKADQAIRTKKIDRKEIAKIDSSNVKRLIEITKTYGWQNKGFLILWHQRGTYGQNNYVWRFFKPYIDEQIAKGNIKKSFWTLFDEDQSIRNNKEQIYGLYTSQFDQFPIKDIANVDKRRTEKGLPPLWYMAKVYGIKLPAGYKKTQNDK